MYSIFGGNLIKTIKVFLVISFCFYVGFTSKVEKVSSLQTNNVDMKIINYNTQEISDPKLPYMQKKVVQNGIKGLDVSYNGVNVKIQKPIDKIVLVGEKIISTFYGELTGYQPNCPGCSGKVACKPGQDVRNGNIYFNDEDFGKLRILAADSKYPCGTVLKITTQKLAEPVIGVVMDRGGAVKGNIVDLLFQEDTGAIGRTNNVKYDVIRMGW